MAAVPATAATIVVNTDTGTVTADGTPVTSINGTTFSTAIGANTTEFLFAGDLNIGASDTVIGVGSRAASFQVGNDANIDPGAVLADRVAG